MQSIKLSKIKKPETVEEFRDNLKRFYARFGNDSLYVNPKNEPCYGIPYSDIESLGDIYKLTNSGFSGDGSSPEIIPLIKTNANNSRDIGREVFDVNIEEELFDATTENSYEIITEILDIPNLQWVTLDNQVYRHIFMDTLGDFSGYKVCEDIMGSIEDMEDEEYEMSPECQ